MEMMVKVIAKECENNEIRENLFLQKPQKHSL